MIEVQDIFREHAQAYFQTNKLSEAQAKAFSGIYNCRTSAMGGHLNRCDKCDFHEIAYNSCRNRHCPKCQTLKKEQWIESQEQYLLDYSDCRLIPIYQRSFPTT